MYFNSSRRAGVARQRLRRGVLAHACAATVIALGGAIAVAAPASAATSYSVSSTVGVGGTPAGLAVDGATHTVYVANSADNTVSVIKGGAVTQTIAVGNAPKEVAVDSATGTAYVTNLGSGTVSVIQGGAVTRTIQAGNGPWGVAVDSSTHTVYVTNAYDNTVSVIQAGAVTATIPVGQDPLGIAVDSSTHTVYVVNGQADTVSVIQNGAVTSTLAVGHFPTSVAVDSSTHTAYVTNADDGTMSVISNGTVSATNPAGNFPFGLDVAVMPGTSTELVADNGSNAVSVVQNGAILQTVALPASAEDVAIDPDATTPTAYVTMANNAVAILTAPSAVPATQTSIASSTNPSIAHQSVTLTATVKPVAAGGSTPTGSVTFSDGQATLGTASLSSGVATLTVSSLAAGSHSITAVYAGNAADQGSTSAALSQTVSADTPAAVQSLTLQYVQGSTAFRGMPSFVQSVIKTAVVVGGQPLSLITGSTSPSLKAIVEQQYDISLSPLQGLGYLSSAQVATLKLLAGAL